MNRLLLEERQAKIDDPWLTWPSGRRGGVDRVRLRKTVSSMMLAGLSMSAMDGSHRVGVGKSIGDLRDHNAAVKAVGITQKSSKSTKPIFCFVFLIFR